MSNWSVKQQLREDIIEAVEKGDKNRVESLLDDGADVNESVGSYLSGKTLLFLSIDKGHVDIAQLLVDRGADITSSVTINKVERCLIDLAKRKEFFLLADYIERRTSLNERLKIAVESNDAAGVHSALEEGANVNVLTKNDSNEINLLIEALLNKRMDIVRILVDFKIDLDYVVKWEDGNEDTARSLAERQDMDDIVTLIDEVISRRKATEVKQSHVPNWQTINKVPQEPVNNNGEVMDIEDEEFNEEESGKKVTRPTKHCVTTKTHKSPSCNVS